MATEVILVSSGSHLSEHYRRYGVDGQVVKQLLDLDHVELGELGRNASIVDQQVQSAGAYHAPDLRRQLVVAGCVRHVWKCLSCLANDKKEGAEFTGGVWRKGPPSQ